MIIQLRSSFQRLLILFTLVSGPACLAADDRDQIPTDRANVHWTNVPRQVLAFYYNWYGNPDVTGHWVHWDKVNETNKTIGSSTHFPMLGAYDSHDPKVIDQHCQWAKQAGITGFIVTWWGRGEFSDQTMPLLLETAHKYGLSVTVYFENVNPPASALKDVYYLLVRYAKQPAWLKVDGRPVLFVYSRAVGQIKLDGWAQVIANVDQRIRGGALFIGDQISPEAARAFDGIHDYNPTGRIAGKSVDGIRAWARKTWPQWVATAGSDRISCLTVIPGFDDSTQGRPLPRPITDRHDGQTYKTLWEEAIAANPDWILITSWNEWHEGSEIEPSAENGDRELKTTAEFARKFLALKPAAR
jgi:glycoprotein endo-alpha-1,2-mannosidase